MKAWFGLILAGFLMATVPACSVWFPGIGIDIGDGGGGPPHCPPGQAKKGRC